MTILTFTVLWKGLAAEKGMKQLGDTTKKTSKDFAGFGKIAATAGLVAGAALIKFGKDAVKAYSEAEQSQAKLQDAFARFPKLADTNIESLRGLNSELAKKTRFDDDATASGQAVLAQFQLTGKEITELTPLLQDYAAKTGKDLPTAAKVFGKALMGNGRGLKEVGIDFKDTGDRGENLTQIIGGLRTQVGGFAEKEGRTAAGQVEILKNQFGELQEEAGSKLLPTLNKIVGGVTKAVIAFGDLSPGVKGALGGFAVAAPTLLLAAGGISKLVTNANAAKKAFDGMSLSAKKATLAASGVGIALGIAAVAFGAWASKQAEAKQETSDLTDALIASKGAIDGNIFSTKAKALQDDESAKKAEELGISLNLLTRAHLGEKDAIEEVNSVLDGYIANGTKQIQTSRGLVTTTTVQAEAARKLQEDLKAGNVTLEEARKRAKDLGGATKGASRWIYDAGEEAKKSAKKIDDWRKSVFEAGQQALDLESSADAVQAAIDDMTQSVKDNGKSLDSHTEKGRNNRAAIRRLAEAEHAHIKEVDDATTSTKKVDRATENARQSFIKATTKITGNRKEAERLADKYGLVDRKINGLNDKKITIKFGAGSYSIGGVKYSVNLTSPSSVGRVATGGLIRGAGTGTSDSIPMMLSNGEFVVNAKATTQHRELLEALNAPGKTPHAPATGMRAGGVVSFNNQGPGGAIYAASQGAKFRDAIATAMGKDIGGRVAKSIGATMGGPAGSAIASGGWASIYAILRRAGARRFTTYAGHDQGASRSRDITPPSQVIADTARRLSSIWYVIYNRRIASKRHGNSWRPYTRSNPHTDHVHVTLNPGVRADKGGLMAHGGMGFNTSGGVERVLSPAQTRDFHNLVKVISNSRGGAVGNTYIVNAPNYVGDKRDLVKALTDLDRQGRLAVVRR